MTYKQIETSREVRLWIGQIIVPVVTAAGTMLLIPEVRQKAVEAAKGVASKVKQTFKK